MPVLPKTCQSAYTRPDLSNSSLAKRRVSTNSANADSVKARESMKPTFSFPGSAFENEFVIG